MTRLYNRADLANRLNVTVRWLYDNLGKLQQQDGFPQPTFGSGIGARWDPAAIDAWIARKRQGSPQRPSLVAVDEIDELDRRAMELAAGSNKPVRRRA